MTYKETLFFVAKCLTISHEEENLKIVSEKVISKQVDWDAVVKVSTQHYVFPALYCNLKRTELLSHLPEELVSYMKHITDLNRERNLQIITQAKEINELLVTNEITPIFLKGAGFLLQDFYTDIAERMVGDIDFLIDTISSEKAIKLLVENGYSKGSNFNNDVPGMRHFPRLINKSHIAAIEIHEEMILEEYAIEFNFQTIKKNILIENNTAFLSLEDQLSLTIIAKQINDYGVYYNNINLRNAYDVFLLSKKVKPVQSIKKFDKLFHPLNSFLAICSEVFVNDLEYKKTNEVDKYITKFYRIITDDKFHRDHHKKWKRILLFRSRKNLILKALVKKEYRTWVFRKIIDRTWYKEKVIQLKSKSNS